jgi:hypothetical protein
MQQSRIGWKIVEIELHDESYARTLIRSSKFVIFYAGFRIFSASERRLPCALWCAPVNAFDPVAVPTPVPDIAAPPLKTAVPPEAELDAAPPEAEESATERVIPEIEHAVGANRQAILDHFSDLDPGADQSMNQIKAALPHVLPGTIEACVRREWQPRASAARVARRLPGGASETTGACQACSATAG